MTKVSTHVLDTASGAPAREVSVHLERHEHSGEWRVVGTGRTDRDGRCSQLVADGTQLSPGIYRLAFDTASYYAAQGVHGLYPIVHVTFSVLEDETHFHLPLLLSPHGYTTYRGS